MPNLERSLASVDSLRQATYVEGLFFKNSIFLTCRGRKKMHPVMPRDGKELCQKRVDFALRRRWGAEAGEVRQVTLTRMGYGEGLEDEMSGLTGWCSFRVVGSGTR